MITLARKFHPLRKEGRTFQILGCGVLGFLCFGKKDKGSWGVGVSLSLCCVVLFSLECGEKRQL